MARKPRRRRKFAPLRMSQRFQKTMIVALGVLLMVVFALPRDACQCRQGQQEDLDRVVATRAGRRFTYGDAKELAERWQRVFRYPMPAEAATEILLSCYEAERAEVRVSQAEVEHAIQNQVFPRRFKIEYVFAKHGEKGAEDARSRVADARERILKIGGKARQQALQSVAKQLGLSIDTAGPLTAQAARTGRLKTDEARDVLDTIMKENLPFTVPIGAVSEVIALKELTFIFRVVSRTPGFAPDRLFYEEQEGWVTQGYGTKKQVAYKELLGERKTTQGEIEQAVREQLLAGVVRGFFVGSAGPGPASLPQATLRDRYRRNNTAAEAACLTLRRSDFEAGIRPTEAELRAFYDQRKKTPRTPTTVGYLQPERVAIQYIVGRRTTQRQWGTPDRKGIEDLIPDEDVHQHYVDNRQGRFKGKPYDVVQGEIRTLLARRHLLRIISDLRTRIAKQSDPNLSELVGSVPDPFGKAFECQTTNEFSAAEARDKPPELRGQHSESLGDVLFGQAGQQFLLPNDKPEEGKNQTYISKNFSFEKVTRDILSAAGMYFFRVIKRTAEHEIEFDDVPEVAPKKDPDKPQPSWPKREPLTRTRIRQDFVRHKAMELAEQKAKEYRTKALDEAFGQLAKALGAEPKDTSIPVPTTPEEPSDPVSRAFYRQLAEREAGDLSTPVERDGEFQIARLVEKKEAQGIQLKVLSFTEDDLPASFDYRASDLELRRRYDKNKFRYLDPPVPIPFEKVKDDIHKLLLKRKTREEATRRIHAALADLGGDKPPKLSDIAKKHKLQLHPGVKVDLAHTEATPQIGKAGGFHDAVADKALKPAKASKELASLTARFCFLLRARDAKAATIDVLAAPYDAIKPEIKLAKDEAKKHYDAQTDTEKHYRADAPAHVGAYLKHEEIKQDAPDWDDVSESVRARLQKLFGDEWAKRPFAPRVRQLRTSIVLEALRTAPQKAPLQVKRAVKLKALTTQLPLKGPAKGVFLDNLHARKLVRALGDGELSQPIETRKGALLAFVEKRTDKILSVLYVTVPNADLKPESDDAEPPTDEQLQKHLESRKERFRRPAEIKAEFLAVDYQALRSKRKLSATDKELRKEHARGVKEKDEAYADATKTKPGQYVPLEFAKAKEIARSIVLRNKARTEAEKLLATIAKQIAPQGAKADLKALAAKHELVDHSTSGWFDAEREEFEPVGLAPDLAQKAFAAKKGQTIGPVLGVKGACLCRRTELKAATVPPLKEIRDAVAKDYETHRDNEHAMDATAKLRKTLAEALAKAKEKPKALRDAVKGATPLIVQIPRTITVAVKDPIYPHATVNMFRNPPDVGLNQSFLKALFRLLPGQITPAVTSQNAEACTVAALVRYVDPAKPEADELAQTRQYLQHPYNPSFRGASEAFSRSWRIHLFGETPPAP